MTKRWMWFVSYRASAQTHYVFRWLRDSTAS